MRAVKTCMDSTQPPIPAVILAGSDRRRGPVPPGAEDREFLVGYKAAVIRVGGRPLVQELRERMLASGGFSLVLVAGPRRIYERLAPGAVIDTDGDLGRNVRHVFRACRWARHLCIAAGDMLPEVEDIRGALSHWHAAGEPAFWLPIVEIMGALGASRWKPRYGIRPGPGEPPRDYLPGHIGIIDMTRVRTRFLCRLVSMVYRLRNRELEHRRKIIYGLVLGDLLGQDLVNLLHLRAPILTWTVLRTGWRLYSRLRRHALSLQDMEDALGQLLIRRRWRRKGCVRFTPCGFLGLALDFDTREEMAAAGGAWSGGDTGDA